MANGIMRSCLRNGCVRRFRTRKGSGVWYCGTVCRAQAQQGFKKRVHETEITFNADEERRWNANLRKLRPNETGRMLFHPPGRRRVPLVVLPVAEKPPE